MCKIYNECICSAFDTYTHNSLLDSKYAPHERFLKLNSTINRLNLLDSGNTIARRTGPFSVTKMV